jgi:hypothetical protein
MSGIENQVAVDRVVRGGTAVGLFLIAGACASHIAFACGFEDPESATFQRGILNVSFPKSAYVLGALTQARLDRTLPPEPVSPVKDLFALNKAALMLHRFGDAPQSNQREEFAFAMVLIEQCYGRVFLSMTDTSHRVHRCAISDI